MNRAGRSAVGLAIVAFAIGVTPGSVRAPAQAGSSVVALRVPGAGVVLDTDVYVPAVVPAPAVLLTHGWGGSKNDLAGQARNLQSAGYLVLAWTARGFGASTGYITMDSPDAEVADVSALTDYLATRGDVTLDKPGDPRVGVSGGSYGGAVSLMAAALDQRIDAVAASITWNDFQNAFFPQAAAGSNVVGVLKKSWASAFFAGAVAAVPGSTCGRLEPTWCAEYLTMTSTGAPSTWLARKLRLSSPGTYADLISAPTLLVQGQADSLFDLEESRRTAAQICSSHPDTPVAMVWYLGGHGAPSTAAINSDSARIGGLIRHWFDEHLRGLRSQVPPLQITRSSDSGFLPDGSPASTVDAAHTLPITPTFVRMSLPNSSATLTSTNNATAPVAAQWASQPLTKTRVITGASTMRMRVISKTPEATLFFSLLIKRASGLVIKPQSLVAPVRLANIPASGVEIDVQLPSIAVTSYPGDRLVLTASTTESGYFLPSDTRSYTLTPLGFLNAATLASPLLSKGQITPNSAPKMPAPIATHCPATTVTLR